MEDLSPTLQLLMSVREALERGDSVRVGIAEFIESEKTDLKVLALSPHPEMAARAKGRSLKETERILFQTLHRGLAGEPILPMLRELEEDLLERTESEIEDFSQKLSLRCLLPLLLLVFPGYLLLLLGPTLERLLISLE